MFRNMINEELHSDQVEWFRPALVKLPRRSNQVPPVSTLVTQRKIKEKKETTADSPL